MRKALCSIISAAFLWLAAAAAAPAATVSIACAAVGIEYRLCREGAEAWAAESGHEVRLIQTPNLANERLALFQQLLAAGSPDIDLFQIDVIWPGILGRHFIDLTPYVTEAERAAHFPAMLANNTVGGALKALPWYGDAGLLYYRRDLLQKHGFDIPETWAGLAAAARAIVAAERAAGDRRLVGFVFQARAYEGLTCNALEWLAGFGAPPILDDAGRPALDHPRAAAALAAAAAWIGDIAPRGVLAYSEEEARGVFQAGHAVFMRNWPYALALANGAGSPVRGKVGIAPLPHGPGGAPAATLGGGGLAASKYSKHPALAAGLARFLTGAAEQRRRALEGGFNPTRPALYRDPASVAARPELPALEAVMAGAVARPSRIAGRKYNRLSATFWDAVHETLAGRGSAADNLARAQRRLERLAPGGQW